MNQIHGEVGKDGRKETAVLLVLTGNAAASVHKRGKRGSSDSILRMIRR